MGRMMNIGCVKKLTALACCAVFWGAGIPAYADPSDKAGKTVCTDAGDADHSAAIRSQRAAFNDAIFRLDIDAVRAVLAEDVLLITGTGSDVYTGREAQLDIWRADSESRGRAIYVRTPACVQVSPAFPIAVEYGKWRGGQSHEAASFASGSYTAKWRLTGGTWLLEVETYMTERCGGSFCPKAEDAP